MQEQLKHDEVMAIAVGETRFAFSVNGVAIAKRHLAKTLGNGKRADERTLARYLVIVPFLATAYRLTDKASESVRYGAIKAKRLYKALGLNEDNIMPFMMVFLQLSEGKEVGQIERGAAITALSATMREAGFYAGGEPAPLSFREGERQSPPKKTLH